MIAATAVGLLAALLFAASASLQQHTVKRASASAHDRGGRRGPLAVMARGFKRFTREPVWLAGTAANVCGSLVQATALHLGSVAVVQLVLTTQLVFTVPLESAWYRRWPRAYDWLAAAATSAGLALFLAVPGLAPPAGIPHRSRAALATVVAVLVAVLLAVAGRRGRSPVNTVLIAVAAGLCFAISAVLMKLTMADLLHCGVAATARDWPGYTLAVANAAGFLAEQAAFTGGSLTAAAAVMMVTNPVASYLLAGIAFQLRFPRTPWQVSALAAAVVLVAAGVVGLASSPTIRRRVRAASSPGGPPPDGCG